MNRKETAQITWPNFKKSFLDPNVPAVLPLPGMPKVELFVDPENTSMCLRIYGKQVDHDLIRPMRNIEIANTSIDGRIAVTVKVLDGELFRPFLGLIFDVSDELQSEGSSPELAIDGAIHRMKGLIALEKSAGAELVIGLAGELLILRAIIQSIGPKAVLRWTGPERSEHDFRFPSLDLEVKSTLSARRVHIISSLEQMEPIRGRPLYLVSVQLITADSERGISVQRLVAEIRASLRQAPQAREHFNRMLELLDSNAPGLTGDSREFTERSTPEVYLVDEQFPRISGDHLANALSREQLQRISDITYRVDLTNETATGTLAAVLAGWK